METPGPGKQLEEYAKNHEAIEDLLDELRFLPMEPHERLLLDVLKQDGLEKEYAAHLTDTSKWQCYRVIDRSRLSFTMKLTLWSLLFGVRSRTDLKPAFHSEMIKAYVEISHEERLALIAANKSFPEQMYEIRLYALKRSLTDDSVKAGVTRDEFVSNLKAILKDGAIADIGMITSTQSFQENPFAVCSTSYVSILQFADDTSELREHLNKSFTINDLL